MAPLSSSAPGRSKSRAWGRTIIVTACFVVLIQLGLLALKTIFPAAPEPYRMVVGDITVIAAAEILAVFILYGLLRAERRSFRDLGLWQPATTMSWLLGIGLGLLTAFWGLSNPALHLPSKLGAVLDPSPWHVYSALVAGSTAGFCEEIIFRGFVVQELAAAGYGRWVQVVGSAFLFGVAHIGLLRGGLVAGLLVIVPTAILGGLYAIIYIAGKRSLMPVIVSHFLNDAAVIPWVFLAVAAKGMGL